MKINDILREAGDDSGDYQQMLAFTRANRVGGVPDEQQIPLALFKELKKQQQQNQALGAELDAAEQRIDQATASGELSKKELGMHRGELDRERAAGEKQQAAVGQLGQQYAEREKASTEQIQQLASQLDQVKTMPGVDANAAKELEKQIKELGEKSVPLDRLQELESSIAAVQNMQTVDDSAIKDLVAQVKDAQEATKELEKTKQSIKQDVKKTVQDTQDQVAQMRQDIERLRQVEKGLQNDVDNLTNSYLETDATLWDIESQTIPELEQNIDLIKTKVSIDDIPTPAPVGQQPQTPPPPQQAPVPEPAPEPATPNITQEPANQPAWKIDKEAIFQKMKDAGHFQDLKVAEDQMNRAIAWATGKKL
jgi:myosin heavy subunit